MTAPRRQSRLEEVRETVNTAILAIGYGKETDGLELLDEAVQTLDSIIESSDEVSSRTSNPLE